MQRLSKLRIRMEKKNQSRYCLIQKLTVSQMK
jgi:hypothetical protein